MKKKKFGKSTVFFLICWLLIGLWHGGFFSENELTEYAAGSSKAAENEEASFEIHILDVGQGLSVLVEADGYFMLYDGGGREYSSYVVAYLKENGIDTLSYLAASHYDEDHISGLVGVLNTTAVEIALTPDYAADSDIYQSFCSMLESSSAAEIHPAAGGTYPLGSAVIQILSPAAYTYEDENDNSIAIRIEYGDFSCILTGDAGEAAEADMIASGCTLDSDLYVAGHHGSSSSSSEAFVSAVSPDYVVISAGAGNSYGHPTERTLSTIKQSGAGLYRTDVQGEIICYTDGTSFWFNTAACDNWQSGTELSLELGTSSDTLSGYSEETLSDTLSGFSEETSSDTSSGGSAGTAEESGNEEDSAIMEYVLNTRSMKFHYPDCQSVSLMSEANKETATADRETLIEEGYSPCGNCNP
ncbi:MAG: MBL fold metallo-hydrolase [Lachnospiraceae bacterium]|nr:MBL fold metallo-hydrolase [Lachnospiraceae bacterium]